MIVGPILFPGKIYYSCEDCGNKFSTCRHIISDVIVFPLRQTTCPNCGSRNLSQTKIDKIRTTVSQFIPFRL
jgi:DNA-directed RNA polymerase subunit RPC12/RpoP